ncbi:tRNA (adenosine(37)-N6)-threonylcarbamoyltransferase complex ATPase subunit type 1 TsaE [Neobacillus piezotolerans]|uniref:tRNA threonylcarbamoyladenosine biosynthesis protein TsaE n=1 Tax=Neobacillus piezotolerans TaxID=2259171 RepID=A0A3D8GJT7_9BACI|nr:tRNA (adenosine(37)-N6)-threonylcarbamoyltransferase complex ATPase subunit type 1 TsaE [Neobacillus piezotolerans]RDU34725.1 tRNA (adenosine(37)-N6)-threonylcarbamoyltransferase complex ATPase subunit type 1 TsaE [Neobacillus piezotolerans]
MKPLEYKSSSAEDTLNFAERLGAMLKPGDVLTLEGDLGAGKTTFTKGLALGLGIKRMVNSPTFTIIKEYHGRLPLYHMDVYRLGDEGEDLGFDEYFEGDGVTVVEWAHLIAEQLPVARLEIQLYHEPDGGRKIVFQPKGIRYERLCEEFLNENLGN